VRALVVTPTRELALQVSESFTAYGKFTGLYNTAIFGGVKQGRQVQMLRRGVDIIVATPGRLLDLMGQGHISLKDIEYCVLDEADHMLDMGFIHDIKRIIAQLPRQRQSLFFSATMPPAIVKLSKQLLGDPIRVTVRPGQTTAERVDQSVYFVGKRDKPGLLEHLLREEPLDSNLVFSRTKHGANKIVRKLKNAGIEAEAIHGNKSQAARQKALDRFKKGDTNVLVATDIAARGIDVDELARVINYDLPNVPETYVHRIGRTGRAEASGVALSFCDGEEKAFLRDIQKLIDQRIEVVAEHPFVPSRSDDHQERPKPSQPPRKTGNKKRSGGSFKAHRRKKSGKQRYHTTKGD
jgi:ATP-dependent RNA helicase RhlE